MPLGPEADHSTSQLPAILAEPSVAPAVTTRHCQSSCKLLKDSEAILDCWSLGASTAVSGYGSGPTNTQNQL